jgi:hypothetical protein
LSRTPLKPGQYPPEYIVGGIGLETKTYIVGGMCLETKRDDHKMIIKC